MQLQWALIMPFLAWQIYLLSTWLYQTPTETDSPTKSEITSETEIIESDMSLSMEKYAVETAKMAFEKYSDKNEAAKYIQENFDDKYGTYWNCFIGDFDGAYHYKEGHKIIFKLAGRPQNENIRLHRNEFGSKHKKTRIVKSHMTPSMEKVALEIAKVAFVKFNDRHEAASYIVHEFDEKYGKYWDCSIGDFSAYIHPKEGTFVAIVLEGKPQDEWIRIYQQKSFGSTSSETKILESEMNPSMEKVAVETAKMAFEKYNDKVEAGGYIKQKFDESYGDSWTCTIGDFISLFHYASGTRIALQLAERPQDEHILLYRRESFFDQASNITKILASDMTPSMEKDAVKTAKMAFEKNDDKFDAAEYIEEEFNKKYGKYWGCAIGDSSSSFAVNQRKGTRIVINLAGRPANERISIFKPSQVLDHTINSETKILRSEMTPSMEKDVIEIAEEGFEIYTDPNYGPNDPNYEAKVAVYITDTLDQIYGERWNCIIGICSSSVQVETGTYINLKLTGRPNLEQIRIYQSINSET